MPMKCMEWLLLLDINPMNICRWERSASLCAAEGPGAWGWPFSLRGREMCVFLPASACKRRNWEVILICFRRVQMPLFSFLGALGNNVWYWFSALQLECRKLTNSFYNIDVLRTCDHDCLLTWKELKVPSRTVQWWCGILTWLLLRLLCSLLKS